MSDTNVLRARIDRDIVDMLAARGPFAPMPEMGADMARIGLRWNPFRRVWEKS